MPLLLKALILGIVEGATEFVPVSSTGHLIIASDWLNYPEAQRATFEIFIQLGAILAVFWHYRSELLALAQRAPRESGAQRLLINIAIAFLPAAVIGFLCHHWIEEHLFSVHAVAIALIVGGIIIWLIEQRGTHATCTRIEDSGWRNALWVGLAQVTSLFPGVSRAGATIMGGMLTGMSRPVATQFSFYLALPTLTAASLFSLLKALPHLQASEATSLLVGFLTAFASALLVIRALLRYVQTHDFKPFAYYRIVFGILLLWLA